MPSVTCVDFFDQNIIQKPTDVGSGSGWIKLKGFYDGSGHYLGYGSKEEAYALLLINKLYKFEYEIHITDQYGGVIENWKGVMPMMQANGAAPDGGNGVNFATLGFYPEGAGYIVDDNNMYVNCIEYWKDHGEIDQSCKQIAIRGGISWFAGNYGIKANGNVIYTNPGPVPGPYGDVTIPDNYFINPLNIPHYTKDGNWDKIKIWEISMGTGSPYKEACVFYASIGIGEKDNNYYARLDFSIFMIPAGGGENWAISSDPNYHSDLIVWPTINIESSSFNFKHNLYNLPQQIGNYTYKTESTDSSCFYFQGNPDWNVTCNMKVSNIYGLVPDPNNGGQPMADPQLIWKYE